MKVVIDLQTYYGPEEAAKEIGKSRRTIFRWLKSGKLLAIRECRLTLIPLSELKGKKELPTK